MAAILYTVVCMSFKICTPDLLQNAMKVTGESTVWFNCMIQCRMSLLPAYGVPTVGENIVTVGAGTAYGKKELWKDCLLAMHSLMLLLIAHT